MPYLTRLCSNDCQELKDKQYIEPDDTEIVANCILLWARY